MVEVLFGQQNPAYCLDVPGACPGDLFLPSEFQVWFCVGFGSDLFVNSLS